MNAVMGLFDYYGNLEWAMEVLENYGVGRNCISMIALEKYAAELEIVMPIKSIAGTANEGQSEYLAGIISMGLSDVGTVVATGALASTFLLVDESTDVQGQSARGGLLGVLMNLGFSKEDAEIYVEGVKQGDILVYVQTDVNYEYRIKAILLGAGGANVNCPSPWQDRIWKIFDEPKKIYEETGR